MRNAAQVQNGFDQGTIGGAKFALAGGRTPAGKLPSGNAVTTTAHFIADCHGLLSAGGFMM
jgi:hypothetical protein